MPTEPSSDQPQEGRTLWEMFQTKLRGGSKNGTHPGSAETYPDPMDWAPGVPAPLNVSHGPEFGNSLVVVATVRHVVRKLAGQKFDFVDYDLRITPRQGKVSYARVRCLPNPDHGWDKLLLRQHDEFSYNEDFEALLNDPSGVFNIEDEATGDPTEFVRLNNLQGPWDAEACEHHYAPDADEAKKEPFKTFRYWDYSRPAPEGEEFLIVEIDGHSGWTKLWRGSSFVL